MDGIKKVFLDVDGVLNSDRSVHVKIGTACQTDEARCAAINLIDEYGELPYDAKFALKCADPVCSALVNKILEESGAGLVLSSTHRKHLITKQYGDEEHLHFLRMYLTAMGIKVPSSFGVTPVMHTRRGKEVQKYLDDLESRGEFVNDYVILDDSTDFDAVQPLVRVDPSIGLSFENYADACKYLAIPAPGLILL